MNKIIGNYLLSSELGSGQYGNVYLSTTQNGSKYAIKMISNTKLLKNPRLLSFLQSEIEILTKISHPNIVHLETNFRSQNNFYLVYEYCNGGTLEDYIKYHNNIKEKDALKLFSQILSGFNAIISNKIMHRDLKPSNILFNDGIVKIADFGFCKLLENNNEMAKTMVGSPLYMAPEVLKGLDYDKKADIWSLGVILYEMITGVCPFEDKTIFRLMNKIEKEELVFPDNIEISKKTQELIRKILKINPIERIDLDELLQIVNFEVKNDNLKNENEIENNKIFEYNENSNFDPLFYYKNENNVNLISKNITSNETLISIGSKSTLEGLEIKSFGLKENLKERNKILMIYKAINSVFELNQGPIFKIINKLIKICEEKYAKIEKSIEKMIETREKYSFDYLYYSEINEIKSFGIKLLNEKREILALKSNFNEDFELKTEEIKYFFNELLENKEKKTLILANNIIDGFLIDELFENLYNIDEKLEDQKYLLLQNQYSELKLFELFDLKINFLLKN